MTSDQNGIDYESVLADLRARRDKLDAAIAGIEAILEALGATPPPLTEIRRRGYD